MNDPKLAAFQLGRWRVEPSRNTLVDGDETRRVEGKVMSLLLALARSPEQLVSKADLFERVWPGRVVVDGVLKRAVSELRRALGDNAREPTFIETVPGRGYRLIHPVRRLNTDEESRVLLDQRRPIAAPNSSPDSLVEPPKQLSSESTSVSNTRKTRLAAVLLICVVSLTVVVSWKSFLTEDQATQGPMADATNPTEAEAMQLLLRGKHLWTARSGESIRESIRFFRRGPSIEARIRPSACGQGFGVCHLE